MAVISRIVTWSDNQVLTAAALNGEFNNLLNDYNGNISNANLAPNAGVAESKVAFSNTGHGHTGGSDGKVISIPASTPPSGWITDSNTWTYVSTDGHAYVVTVNADLTASIGVGDRISLSQASAQYFIVTAISVSSGVTTLTLYGGTNYAITAGAISSTRYSHAKIPFGFPANPSLWSELLTDTVRREVTGPTDGVWSNIGSLSLNVPIGIWKISYLLDFEAYKTLATDVQAYITLGTTTTNSADLAFQATIRREDATVDTHRINSTIYVENYVSLSAKQTYYLNVQGQASLVFVRVYGDWRTTVIRAVCAYL